jgi:hypothetical protein
LEFGKAEIGLDFAFAGEKRKRTRNYVAEYQRRLERAKKRGLSKSQARGHPRKRERSISAKVKSPLKDDRMAQAVAYLHRGSSLSQSAADAGVSAERLRKFLRDSHIATRRRGKWKVNIKKINWEVLLYTRGRAELVQLNDPEAVSRAMSFMATVRYFKDSQDKSALEIYRGESVRDMHGKYHPFETNSNSLYRLASSVPERPDKFYRPFFR